MALALKGFRPDIRRMARHGVDTIKLIGNSPALDLLNTVDPQRTGDERDVLRSFADDAAWAERLGILSPSEHEELRQAGSGGTMAAVAHEHLLGFREDLRAIVRARVAGEPPSPEHAARFARAVSDMLPHREFALDDEKYRWRWRLPDPDLVLHKIVLEATDLLAAIGKGSIKVCAAAGCGWYFRDTSRGGRRRWCSEESCGTPARVAELRNRRRADP